MSEHMWRGHIVWERPDGSRFDWTGVPRLSKGAANGDVTRQLRYPGRNRPIGRRVQRSMLHWHVVEVDGEAVA